MIPMTAFDQLVESIAPSVVSVCIEITPEGSRYRVAWSSAQWPEGVYVTSPDRTQAYQMAYQTEITGHL